MDSTCIHFVAKSNDLMHTRRPNSESWKSNLPSLEQKVSLQSRCISPIQYNTIQQSNILKDTSL